MKENFFAEGQNQFNQEDLAKGQRVKDREGNEGIITEVVSPTTVRVQLDDERTFLYNPSVLYPLKKGGITVNVDFREKKTGTSD